MDRRAWQATVHGDAGVRHNLVTKSLPPPGSMYRKKIIAFLLNVYSLVRYSVASKINLNRNMILYFSVKCNKHCNRVSARYHFKQLLVILNHVCEEVCLS